MNTIIHYYIYGRVNLITYGLDWIKLGITSTPIERDQSYITGEMSRGHFLFIVEIEIKKKSNFNRIDRQIKKEFIELQFKGNAGTEFYNKSIENLLYLYLDKINVKYHKLTEEDINNLRRKYREKQMITLIETLDKHKFGKYVKPIIVARDYQISIIEKTVNYLHLEDKGILVEPCGIGKTIIALLSTRRLHYRKILIGVPSLELLSQWQETTQIIFPDIKILKICGNINIVDIENFLIENNECVVIVMYQSTRKIKEVCNKLNYIFDIKILDEVHHITSSNVVKADKKNSFIQFLKIESIKQLSLTATLKINSNEVGNTLTNVDKKYFGRIIDKKNLFWAIKNKIVCDYKIKTIRKEEDNIFSEGSNKQLFLSSMCALKNIKTRETHHQLLICNSKVSANEIYRILQSTIKLSEDYNNLYVSTYYSEKKERKKIIEKFKKSPFGILIVVHCLGEGWDCKILDGIVICENMGSIIRIIQTFLRPCRKNIDEPNKIATITIPIVIKNGEE